MSSSSQTYPTMPGVIDPRQMCGVDVESVASTEWYAPSSYAYDQPPYMTPYPSSTVESQPWTSYARSSIPDTSMPSYAFQTQNLLHHPQPMTSNFKDPSRPRSSPSTFGTTVDNIEWPATSGLGIQYTSTAGQPTPITSTFPSSVFQQPYANPAAGEPYSTSSPPELRQPQPRRSYAPIQPNPNTTTTLPKRSRPADDPSDLSDPTKRRKRGSSSVVADADLSEDDRFLVQLKEDESLPWKDIAARFTTDKGQNLQVAALQMRYKRLRERYRMWEEQDLQALRAANEYWEKYRWEIVSSKMLEYGVTERWPARHCARKWQEMEAMQVASTYGTTPGSHMATQQQQQVSSPGEGPMQFQFLPIS